MNDFAAAMLSIGIAILAICGLIYIASIYNIFIMFVMLGVLCIIVGFGTYAMSSFKKRH